jgi:hypothetical protein
MLLKAKKYGKINKAYFDAGYDWIKNYLFAHKRGIKVIIKPRRLLDSKGVKRKIKEIEEAKIKTEQSKATLLRLKTLEKFLAEPKKWKEKTAYGKRWAVENRYSVLKSVF